MHSCLWVRAFLEPSTPSVDPSHACFPFFFFNDTATTEIYTLSLHDALPISPPPSPGALGRVRRSPPRCRAWRRSEEHTSELQSLTNLVCRLLLEKKKRPPPALRLCRHE